MNLFLQFWYFVYLSEIEIYLGSPYQLADGLTDKSVAEDLAVRPPQTRQPFPPPRPHPRCLRRHKGHVVHRRLTGGSRRSSDSWGVVEGRVDQRDPHDDGILKKNFID